ncbi:hypothetical protein NM688_g43 [Phlebia brevispora]|uniref:Uncharacterized protein n=1 Tax=Phlebia brevispora TaxID=194682 RepID=A0ACC1TFG5_9APHY|nr:hypothetical protein NM688_g43 [Phlebia brevispora]
MYLTLSGLTLLAVFIVYHVYRYKPRLPPGPSGLPIVGNIIDLNTQELWRKAHHWGKRYGLRVSRTPIIFLERGEVAMELLHKRGMYYSDRPHLTMAGDLCGMDSLTPLIRIDKLKLERKRLGQALSPSATKKWRPALEREVMALLRNLHQSPNDHVAHFQRMTGSTMLRVLYGYRAQSANDPLLHAAEEMMKVTSTAMLPNWLIDFLPFYRRLKSNLQSVISRLRIQALTCGDKDTGEKRDCFCGTLLLSNEDEPIVSPELENRVKWMAMSLYGAGMDSSVVTLTQFIMLMILHPDIQRQAQEEIDKFVGPHRVPDFGDRDNLPFVDCILKETLRWGVPIPITPSHRLIQKDSYENFEFPEGSLFTANIWSMLHDERVYTEPLEFRPERFLNEKHQAEQQGLPPFDPYTRCPGIHFADQSIWLAMARMLACFNIQPFVNHDGEVVLPEMIFDGGAFRQPKPFKCRITLRRKGVLSTLQE